jgi:hypothetical protein
MRVADFGTGSAEAPLVFYSSESVFPFNLAMAGCAVYASPFNPSPQSPMPPMPPAPLALGTICSGAHVPAFLFSIVFLLAVSPDFSQARYPRHTSAYSTSY